MARFILDGRHIQDHFPGIGRYLFNLVSALSHIAPEENLRVIYDPSLINTRYDLASLASSSNVEVLPVGARTWSIHEQFLGGNRKVTAGASTWHSGYYVMPYWLPMPAVVTLEDLLPLVAAGAMPGAFNRFIYRTLNGIAAHRAAHVITLSKAASADIQRILRIPPHKISVIGLAADARFQVYSSEEVTNIRERLDLPEHYVLYLGSNKPHKNLERLVNAWVHVESDATLVIAGHWDSRFPEAQGLVRKSGLESRILFRQNISDADLPALVSGAEVFAFPSLYEGFGLPPLEAMASGVPVVCSNASSLPEVVGDAALLFEPLDVDALASALTCVLEDAALRDSLRGRGLVQSARFTWERTARETLDVYKRVVRERESAGTRQ
jgi:glycosyltransferase involved in cell wall biosynthesis